MVCPDHKFPLAVDNNKIFLSWGNYKYYFNWGFPDHSARIATVDQDKVCMKHSIWPPRWVGLSHAFWFRFEAPVFFWFQDSNYTEISHLFQTEGGKLEFYPIPPSPPLPSFPRTLKWLPHFPYTVIFHMFRPDCFNVWGTAPGKNIVCCHCWWCHSLDWRGEHGMTLKL